MSKPRTQRGQVYLERNGESWSVRFYVHEGGVSKRKAHKLCEKSVEYPSKESVRPLADAYMATINTANAVNDAAPGHNCPVCGNRCPRTIEGKFAKQQVTA